MVTMMRDERLPMTLRLDMAKVAAPYVHPQLASVEQTGLARALEALSITHRVRSTDGTVVPSLPVPGLRGVGESIAGTRRGELADAVVSRSRGGLKSLTTDVTYRRESVHSRPSFVPKASGTLFWPWFPPRIVDTNRERA